jgi:peptidyl-dipeptidase Dcp
MNTITSSNSQSVSQNPLLQKWKGPYGGVPSFDEYKVSDFKPAIEIAINEKLDELDKIANNDQLPTFENTIAALELSGQSITRIREIYEIFSSNIFTPEFGIVETEMSPKLSELNDKM